MDDGYSAFGNALLGTGNAGAETFNRNVTFKTPTWRLTLDYKFNDDQLIFANYARGNKPGGLNGTAGEGVGLPSYDEERADNFELGWKAKWADGRVQTKVAGYFNKIKKYQLTTAVVDAGSSNGVTSIVTNQGDAEIKGLEFDIQAIITKNLTAAATYAYTDAKFTNGCDPFQYTLTSGGQVMGEENTPINPNAIADAIANGDADLAALIPQGDCSIKGKQIPITSKHQASGNISWDAPINDELNYFINGNVTYEGGKFVQVHNGMKTPNRTLLGARVGVYSDKWRITAFVRNLTNNRDVSLATRWFDLLQGSARGLVPTGVDTGSPRGPFVSYTRGRQFGIEGKVNF